MGLETVSHSLLRPSRPLRMMPGTSAARGLREWVAFSFLSSRDGTVGDARIIP